MSLSSFVDDYGTAATFLSLAAVVVAASSFLWISSSSRDKEKKEPWPVVPGSIPLLGHFTYIKSIKNLTQQLEKWADVYGKEHGCFAVDFPGGKRYVVACREDRALEILKQRPRSVYRSTPIREAAHSVGAKGVFTAEGDIWKHEHKWVAAALNKNHIREDYLPTLKVMAGKLIDKWRKQSQQQEQSGDAVVSINQDVGSMTADSISKVMLDRDYDFLHNPESKMARNIQQMFIGAMVRGMCPLWYWRIPVIGQYLDGFGFPIRAVWDTIMNAVKDVQKKSSEVKDGQHFTFLQRLIALIAEEKSSLPRERIVGNALTLFMAGTDTVEKSLVMALYILATTPKLQKTLQDEVEIFDWRNASLDDLYTKCPRVKSFLHETHRYYALPFMMLETAKDIPFCGTMLQAKQDIIVLSRYCNIQKTSPTKDLPTQVAPGQDYSPERYLVKTSYGKLTCPDPSIKSTGFLAFGYGVRSCPGRRYAEVLSYCVLIEMLQTFDFELSPDQPSVEIVFDSVAMLPDHDVQLKLSVRENK